MSYHPTMSTHSPRDVPIEPEEFEEFKRRCRQEGIEWTEHLINMIHRLPYDGTLMTTRHILEQERPQLLDSKPDYNPAHRSAAFSPLRREQTWREFYATIDRVLGELDLVEEVKRRNIPGGRKSQQEIVAFCELLYPAYVRLRELGYNCYPDLTA